MKRTGPKKGGRELTIFPKRRFLLGIVVVTNTGIWVLGRKR